MKKIKKIITHPGNAHRDDLYSVAIALVKFGFVPVYRQEPNSDDLEDPEVLVLDVGMRYEPDKMNFDHHQFLRDAQPECALSLFLRHLDIEKWFLLQPWYRFLVVTDSKGPMIAARELGLEKIPQALLYFPIEAGLIETFESKAVLEWVGNENGVLRTAADGSTILINNDPLIEELHTIGSRLIATARKLYDEYQNALKKIEVIHLKGLSGFMLKKQINPLITRLVRERELDNRIAFSISPSDRDDEGWVLYRYNDHPRIDFNHLKDFYNHRLKFIHSNGFIAKTIKDLPFVSVIELMEAAID